MEQIRLLDEHRDAVYALDGSKVEYIGLAHPGTLISEAKWKIKKLIYSGDNVIGQRFANGDTHYDKVWNDRSTYEYKAVT
jgi:hypothetical protein